MFCQWIQLPKAQSIVRVRHTWKQSACARRWITPTWSQTPRPPESAQGFVERRLLERRGTFSNKEWKIRVTFVLLWSQLFAFCFSRNSVVKTWTNFSRMDGTFLFYTFFNCSGQRAFLIGEGLCGMTHSLQRVHRTNILIIILVTLIQQIKPSAFMHWLYKVIS